ncbi:HYR domain-containing protein [Flavobacterium flavigenum]|uniref:HYR domain-containing protein n=1 Tax=Flavobacterium flavigenum TaxID=3003258 RepID=UPI0024823AA7|nr:HYR domain-containing protein [Flavobacterium flavigenum]
MIKNYRISPCLKTVLGLLLFFVSAAMVYGQNGCPQVAKSILDGANGFKIDGKAAKDDLGFKTKSAGDINGDGIPDIMIGAPGADFGGASNVGEIYVIFGGSGFSFDSFDVSTLNGTNGFVIRGVVADEKLGDMISSVGDFNQDGIDDIIVGDNFNSGAKGTAFIFYGKNSGFQPLYNRTDIDNSKGLFITLDATATTTVKDVSAAGDINHDGVPDAVITENSNGKTNYYIIFGHASVSSLNTSSLSGANGFTIKGYLQSGSGTDSTARNAGDVNHDGIGDLIIGCPSYKEGSDYNVGRVVVLFGKNSVFPASVQLETLNVADGFVITNTGSYNNLGKSVAAAGDFNADGIDDFIIGAPGKALDGQNSVGEAYVVFGRSTFPATFAIESLNASTGVIFQGKDLGSQFGFTVAGIFDVNNDGKSDIAISSKRGISNNGSVYIVFGGTTATGIVKEKMILNTIGYQIFDSYDGYSTNIFGCDVAGIRDFNQDGKNDFILGYIRNADYYGDKGNAYIFYGEKIDRIDAVKPTISCPVNQQLFANTPLPNYVSFLPDLIDNCTYVNNFDLSITQNPPQGTLFTGDTNVTITVTDLSGNTNSCTFLVKLKSAPPVPDCKTLTYLPENLNGSNGFTIIGENGTVNTGYSVNKAGDVNGDGISDFIVSAMGSSYPFSGTFSNTNDFIKARIYVVFGKSTGFPSVVDLKYLNGTNGFKILDDINFKADDQTGYKVSAAGDLNKDGIDDFMFSAPTRKGVNWNVGALYVIFGKSGGFPAEMLLSNLNGSNGFTFMGNNYYEAAGYSIDAIGDFNNDGFDDIALAGTGNVEKVFVIYGKNGSFPALISGSDIDGTNGCLITSSPSAKVGRSVTGLGDVNGDGIPDIAISTYDGVKMYVIYGRSGFPGTFNVDNLNGSNGFVVTHSSASLQYGNISKVGDLNHDGLNDISFNGIYILFGSSGFPVSVDLNNLNGSNGFKILAGSGVNDFGGIGDFNKDGIEDYLFKDNDGTVYLLYGKNTWTNNVNLSTITPKDGLKINLGFYPYKTASGFAGDINNDGFDDIIIGNNKYYSPFESIKINEDPGKAYVIYGKAVIADTEKPVFSNCPTNKILAIGDAIPDYKTTLTVTDNCDNSPVITQSPVPGTVYTGGIQTIILKATDSSTNEQTCTFTIAANADLAPVLICPGNQLLACGSLVPDYFNLLTVTDDTAGDIELTQYPGPGSTFFDGMQIDFSAKDKAGNVSNCSIIINVSGPDTTPPTFTCPSNVTLNCGDVIPNYAIDPMMNLGDNCSQNVHYEITPAPGTPFYDGILIKIKYTDESGNFDTCSFNVHLATPDLTPPVITCITDQNLACGSVLPDYRSLISATDNCLGTITYTQNPIVGSAFTPGMTVTITAKDVSDNTSTCSFKVNASADTTAPVITCIGDQTLVCGSTIPDYTALIPVTDNCDASPVLTQSPIAGTAFTNGMNITITAKDVSNNTSTCSFKVNASADTTAPVITCIGDQTLVCGSTIPDYTALIPVTDNCDASPLLTQSPIAGTAFTNGMTITITAKDVSNNSSMCSFKVNTSADTTSPVITCIGDQTLSCGSIIPDYTPLVSANDNCDSSPIITQSPSLGSVFTDGMTVTLTAKDASGNTSYCSFKVNMAADVTAPLITCIADQNLAFGTVLPDYRSMIFATDNCDSNLTVTQTPIAGTNVTDGMTVTMTVSDNSGNPALCSFKIYIIQDTEAPVFSCITDQVLECSVSTVPDYTKMIFATDNTDPNPIIKQTPISGTAFSDGMTITIEVSDKNNNSANCSFQLFKDPVLVDAGDDVQVNEGETVQLYALALEKGTFSWSPATGLNTTKTENPIAKPSETTTYKVVFTNSKGCKVEDYITITVIPLEKDETKYGFSPNGDGINDFWEIDDITEYPNNEVLIYNRWGDLVFQTKNYNNTTNVFAGIANKSRNLGANQLPEGTYFFEIRTEQPNHFKKTKGYLVLKR